LVSVSTSSVAGTGVGDRFVGVAGTAVDVGSTMVGVTVGSRFVGVATVTIDVGGTAVDDDVDVGADPQAATKIVASMVPMI